MQTFEVTIRTYSRETLSVTCLDVLANTTFDAIVCGLKTLNLSDARVNVFATPQRKLSRNGVNDGR